MKTLDFIGDWRRTHLSNEITSSRSGEEVIIFGWVEDKRDLGGLTFLTLRDRVGVVQVTVSKKNVSQELGDKVQAIGRQFTVGVRGTIKEQKGAPSGVEVIPKEIRVLNEAHHPLPLDPTGRVPADIDVRLDARVLDLRRPETSAIFRIRHETLVAIREYFLAKGYLEVNTPKIIASATEGGAALFEVEYFEEKAYLAQSPQLYKEQLTTAFEKVFEVGTYFRAEESHTRRHLNEYTSVDIEEAFATYETVTSLLEGMIAAIHRHVIKACSHELGLLKRKIGEPGIPFKRFKYDQVVDRLNREGVTVKWGEDIPTAGERKLGELYNEYYFILDWPTKIKPFYIMPRMDNSEYSESFDLMFGGLEIASGGTRVHTKDLLAKRLSEQGLRPENFKHHLKVFDFGMPPHAGAGIGLERIIMAVTGVENIRECILYPRDRERLIP